MPRRAAREARPPRTPLAAGILGAVLAAALSGAVALGLAALSAWAGGWAGPSPWRVTALGWLVAHRVPMRVAVSVDELGAQTATLVLVPLVALALVVLALAAAGRWAARSAAVTTWAEAARALVALAVTYAALAAAVAALASTPAVEALPAPAAAAGGLLALFGAGAGIATAPVLRADLLRRTPVALPPMLRAATAGMAVLVGGGAMLLAGSLMAHWSDVDAVRQALAPSGGAALALSVLGACLVPNAALWAAAYAVGPGFAVGAGTSVAPGGVALDQLPAFPLLAALPDVGPAPATSLLALAVPIAAGVVVGLVLVRRLVALGPTRPERAAALAASAGAASGIWLGLLTALSGGSLGAQRLAVIGPDASRVALIAALEVGVVAAATAWEAPRMAARWEVWQEARQSKGKARREAHAAASIEPAAETVKAADAVQPASPQCEQDRGGSAGRLIARAAGRVRQAAASVAQAADAAVGAAVDEVERPHTVDIREAAAAETAETAEDDPLERATAAERP